MRNLVDNALKYSGGTRVVVRLQTDGLYGTIEIEDNGAGIRPEHIGHIFQRFYRVDKARSRELGGTGLGLAIVKHTAIAHGGSIEVESTPGRGSTFVMRLPLRSSQG